jgi:transposase
MFIECFKNNGKDYLRVTEVFSDESGNGSKCRRRVLKNIGPLDRFDDGKPDYLIRLRQSFRDGKPLITSLSELLENKPVRKHVTVNFDIEKASDCVCDPKNIGYFLLDGLYDALGIYDVLNKHKSRSKLEYDLNGLAKLLVFGRVLWPDSKIGTFENRDRYLLRVTSSEKPKELYRALDCLDKAADAIQKRMNTKIQAVIGRDTEVCFYDVTNFWFEIGQNDEDEKDAKGNILRPGLRKKGVSKEKRGEPIVQMGLFIDSNGIPIAYRLFPGNNTDQTTLRPALEKSIDRMDFSKVIVVADGGLNNGPNIARLLDRGNGYILSKSTKRSDKSVKAWMLQEEGYEWNEARTFKVKSKIRERKITDALGNTRTITEKLVCYWSKKHYDREIKENAKFLEYLESVIKNPDKLKDKPKKIEKFLEKTEVVKDTGEIVDTKTLLSIDQAKIAEYKSLLGYYTIMTSETEKSDREIINKYHGLSRIEDSFRITKSDLEGRPVYVRTPEHINAHFLICFIALVMIRLIQHNTLKFLGKNTLNDDGWESGVTADRIKDALASFQADALPGGYFRLSRPNDDMRLILASLGIDAHLLLPTAHLLRNFKLLFDKSGMTGLEIK